VTLLLLLLVPLRMCLPCHAGVGAIDRVVEAVESTLAGQQLVLLGRRKLPDLDLPKVRCNRYSTPSARGYQRGSTTGVALPA
jgi:hypothetical protein